MKNKIKEKILEFHKLVVMGLVNGLSHTFMDGRNEELEFWRRRSLLFDAFDHCVMNLITNQSYESYLKELEDIAREGYRGEMQFL